MDEYFDDVFIFDYFGVKKFYLKIFLKVFRKFDVKFEEVVMVGDCFYLDIYGVKNVGMMIVWFRYGKYRDREMEYVEYVDFIIERFEDLFKIIRGLNNEEKVCLDMEVYVD